MDDLRGQLSTAKFVSDYNSAQIIVHTFANHASPTPPPAPQAKPNP